jgi:glycosyltransferase involved in cell wall biosynthesis
MSRVAPAQFAVVVPCYNEEGIIRETIAELRRVFAGASGWELVVVNDGSSDRSREILDELAGEVPELEVVHHERNRGYGAALKTGIRRASAELIVITDADGTYPNERLPELLEIAKDADMVVGARTAADVQYPIIRKIPKAFLRRYASWLAGQTIPDINSGMRVFRKSVAERFFKVLPDTFSFTITITLSMLTNRYDVRFVPIGYKTRVGKSKIKPVRDTLRFCQLLVRTGMYFAPLRVLLPLIALLSLMFSISFSYDVLVLDDLTEKSLILLLFAMNTAIFALLADMIDKRSP